MADSQTARRVPARGPTRWRLARLLPKLRRDFLTVFVEWQAEYGDLVRIPFRRPPTLQLNNPEDIRHVLVEQPNRYRKTGVLTPGGRLLGRGILASREPLHHRQRRVIQPALHPDHLAFFAGLMLDAARRRAATWQDGAVVNVHREMLRWTLDIVGWAFFSTDLTANSDRIIDAFTVFLRHQRPYPTLRPEQLSSSAQRRFEQALSEIDAIVYGLIRARRQAPQPGHDLLGRLLSARFEDGSAMEDALIRDEIVNMLVAGHETAANSLSWLWSMLWQHPTVERRLTEELQQVVGDRPAQPEDVTGLGYADMVLSEVLRLYPPVWVIGRMSVETDELASGTSIPPNTQVLMLPYVVHRNPKVFPDPESFDPDRFSPPEQKKLPRFAYFPFGGGPRGCIGETFARLEGAVMVAVFVQQFRLTPVPGRPATAQPLVTLRPRDGVWMQVHRRR